LNLNALNPGDFLHGRYTYLPLTGLMLLVATGWHLAKKAQTFLLVAVGLVAVVFSVLTISQEGTWKDDLTVYTVAHQIAPHNEPLTKSLVGAHVHTALELAGANRCAEAVPTFEQAIQQYPEDWFAWAGLAECRFKLNDLPGAERALRRAAELSHEPRTIEMWQQLRAKMGLSSAPLE
jgi:cytochrome c-type biogenesis protein CcmH/NrfG